MESIDPKVDPALVPPQARPVLVAETQDEYHNLASIRTPAGQVITRWTFTPEERAKIAAGEDLFITILSRGQICPMSVTVGFNDWLGLEQWIRDLLGE
jgi:hypothetical protein